MKKKKIIISIIGLVVILGLYFIIAGTAEEKREMVKVVRGDVLVEIFESGRIKEGEEISLSFGYSGRVAEINFKDGDPVKKGEVIISLDDEVLQINLEKARGGLRAAETNLQKILSGSKLEIQTAQIVVDNASTTHSSSVDNLEKTEERIQNRLTAIYREAIPLLDSVILTVESAHNRAVLVAQEHFSLFSTQDARDGKEARDKIEERLNNIKKQRTEMKIGQAVEIALSETETDLREIFSNFELIIEILERTPYRQTSQDEISLITSEKLAINQSLATVSSLINSISTAKTQGGLERLTAKSQVKTAKGALEQALHQLSRIISPARKEDISLAQININQSRSEIRLLERAIAESIIKAPFDGKILEIKANREEMVQLGEVIVLTIPDQSKQVEINIYEGDITGLRIGNPVKIEIIAFPGKVFKGEVVFIGRTPKIINGIVHYEVIANIQEYPEGLVLGMTADVTIITEKRENVLFLPSDILDGETVTVLRNGVALKVYLETGLKGSDGKIEIISGLNENDQVVAPR